MRRTFFAGAILATLVTGLSAPAVALPAAANTSANVSAGAPAGALTSADYRLGPVRSSAAHGGYAKATVRITSFGAETFKVYGTLYDRDPHRGHCAYIRARFHYMGGGTGWARPRGTCAPSGRYELSSDGEIKRVDIKICVYDRRTRSLGHCRVDSIRNEDLAN
ncbi:hypothetical protein ACFQ08_34760 [Streptosporangium algeriense]|uniref:Secreted protein n=1 Tax=Streptosporangium algeriense TaxID=1682748 RepID=A0ABW3E134_9ACTN